MLDHGLIWCSEAREQGYCGCAHPLSFPGVVEKPEQHLHQADITLLMLEQEVGLADSKFTASLGRLLPDCPSQLLSVC